MSNEYLANSSDYDNGVSPAIAINNAGRFVEVHCSQTDRLWCIANSGSITAPSASDYTDGTSPRVALNNNNVVVECHQTWNITSTLNQRIFWIVGSHQGTSVSWGVSTQITGDGGNSPAVALNDSNVCVTVNAEYTATGTYHGLVSRVGTVDPVGKTINWGTSAVICSGMDPEVAMNNNGAVVMVYKDGDSADLRYRVGFLNAVGTKTINWGAEQALVSSGESPSVALADDNSVVFTYASGSTIIQRNGTLNGNGAVNWKGLAANIDTGAGGARVAVSSDGKRLIQVHMTSAAFSDKLWSSNCAVTGQFFVAAAGGSVPAGAAHVGARESNGTELFLARGTYNGGVHLGKVRTGFTGMTTAYGGKEITLSNYEVLVAAANTWVTVLPGGALPANALPVGHESDGTPLYAGRVAYMGGIHLGKYRPGFPGVNIGYGGLEVTVASFDVLVAYT